MFLIKKFFEHVSANELDSLDSSVSFRGCKKKCTNSPTKMNRFSLRKNYLVF